MARPLLALLAVLTALPARAQGPLEPSGRLPPVAQPTPEAPQGTPPPKATPVEPPAAPLPRGAVLEPVTGTVREIDRRGHKLVVEGVDGERVTLSMDRNTMIYTSAGLGTVLDVAPGVSIRAGRNAEFVAYWVQVRPASARRPASPPSTPGQGTGPGGGSGAPPEGAGGAAPGSGATPGPTTPGPGAGPGAGPGTGAGPGSAPR